MKPILSDELEHLLREERRILGDVRLVLASCGATPEDQGVLRTSIEQLDAFFLLVVVGEFNAGKSAFINALLGQSLLEEGVTPTTTEVVVISHGATVERTDPEPTLRTVSAPIDLLRDLHIVDTPGTNAIMREHERITSEFVPRSDMVLFVTSADRPYTETERQFLQRIADWGKKVVIVVNKVDLLDRPEDVAAVKAFVASNAAVVLGVTPELFCVSARLALRAKLGEPALWERSGFDPLERFIHDSLDDMSRLQLKLLNPLGVAQHVTARCLSVVNERLDLLKDDLALLDDVDRQMLVYRQDMTRDFAVRMGDIEKTVIEMEQRGHAFFDEILRIGRVFDLIGKTRVRQEFERDVVAGAPAEIERKVTDLIDWLVSADFRQWQAVTSHLAERRREYKERIVGDDATAGFEYDRARLFDAVSREAQQVVDGYDRPREAQALADGARSAVAATAAVGAGAVGLGAVVATMATSAAGDVTGLAMAGVMAVVGLFIIPAKRRSAKADLRRKVTEMREKLTAALRGQFEREVQRSVTRTADAIAPYSRFVRAEQQKLGQSRDDLTTAAAELDRLQAQVRALR
jgi:small GTP-binding protein